MKYQACYYYYNYYLECAVVFVLDQRLNSEFLPCQQLVLAAGDASSFAGH